MSLYAPSSLNQPALSALARAMLGRDRSTCEHAERVQKYALELARQADIVDPPVLKAIEMAALFHDIGKLAIPDQLLNKPGRLTREEYDQVKQHAVIGADILETLPAPGSFAVLVRHHHENWDGSGYPDGKSRDEIPLGARVLAIADCYDALTSDRPYRRAMAHNSAIAMVHEGRGTMFDPRIADAFLQIVWRLRPTAAASRSTRFQISLDPVRPAKAGAL
jgi:putative nucleotidyltransferase with HDIG domain